jgi:hypothetical protein
MAKLDGDDQTVAGRWGQDLDFAQRSAAAGIDDCMRGIIQHGLSIPSSTAHLPAKVMGSANHTNGPQPAVPTFREWAHARLGVDWTEAQAKAYYDTRRINGEDVGPVTPESPKAPPPSRIAANGYGNAPLIPIGPPPGVAQLDRLMAHEDAKWRQRRARGEE